MSVNRILNKFELKQAIGKWNNISAIVCGAGIIGIILSPTIPIIVGVTLLATVTGYYCLKKINELHKYIKQL